MKKRIAQVVLGLPLEGHFDYLVPSPMQEKVGIGSRVFVPFSHRKLVGVVTGFSAQSPFPYLKSIFDCLDNQPFLDARHLSLTKAFAEFYGCSWGEAIDTSLPLLLRKKTFVQLSASAVPHQKAPAETTLVIDQGSRESQEFIAAKIHEAFHQDQGVIVLVPEMVMVRKVEAILQGLFDAPVVVLERKSSPKEELAQWIELREGKKRFVIGTRSAIFAPVQNCGLIVIFDEENASYKQDQSPFYRVRDVARLRSKIEGSSLLFVSAAPSAELWHLAEKEKWQKKNFASDKPSEIKFIDLLNYKYKQLALSYPLQSEIQATLTLGGKVVLILNRRGFSSATKCSQCGYAVKCPRCDTNLTHLYSKKKIVCHLCNYSSEVVKVCPQCKGNYLHSFGAGIEKIESELARLYPVAQIMKYDKESQQMNPQANIIIATQAVLRELDQVKPALIAVLDVDGELNRMDFRSSQRVFTLLMQLCQLSQQKVIVQTEQMDNYCLKAARKMDLEYFYKQELKIRRELNLPPFTHLVAVCLRGTQKDVVFDQARLLFDVFKEQKTTRLEILDPQPDILPKLRDRYRFTIMLKGRNLKKILSCIKSAQKFLKKKSQVVMTINIDP